jgi:lysophospholipase L1-like esterase
MKIICFGDSNTYGFDPRNVFGGRYPAADRWPDILAAKTGWKVINEGANGRQIPRNPYPLRLIKDQQPVDLFLVMLGTNDLLQGATAEEAAARMEHFLRAILPYFPKLLLISPPPLKRGAWVSSDALVAESIRLCDEYKALAQNLIIPFVDTSDWYIPLAFDGVHFTEEGNRMFAENLLKHLS